MPYRNDDKRANYQSNYHKSYNRPGRPESNDRKIIVSFRCKSSVSGRVSRILYEGIATGNFPYKNQSQIYEDLVIRGLGTLAGRGRETVEEALQYLRAVSASESLGTHRKEAQAAFGIVQKEITELLAIKAEDQAVHYYHATVRAYREMSPHVWRDWFLKQMETAFPKLAVQRPQGVDLADIESNDDEEREIDHGKVRPRVRAHESGEGSRDRSQRRESRPSEGDRPRVDQRRGKSRRT